MYINIQYIYNRHPRRSHMPSVRGTLCSGTFTTTTSGRSSPWG